MGGNGGAFSAPVLQCDSLRRLAALLGTQPFDLVGGFTDDAGPVMAGAVARRAAAPLLAAPALCRFFGVPQPLHDVALVETVTLARSKR